MEVVEPMKKWTISFDGQMRLEHVFCFNTEDIYIICPCTCIPQVKLGTYFCKCVNGNHQTVSQKIHVLYKTITQVITLFAMFSPMHV